MKWKVPEGYVSIKQAAESLGCSEKTIRNRIKAGDFKDIKMVDSPFGEAWVISKDELGTVKEILDVVKVTNEFELKDFMQIIKQVLEEREDKLIGEINELKQTVNQLQNELAERDRLTEERDKHLMESIREIQRQQQEQEEPKKGFFARLFGK